MFIVRNLGLKNEKNEMIGLLSELKKSYKHKPFSVNVKPKPFLRV